MRTTFLNLIFLFAIVGCKQPAIQQGSASGGSASKIVCR